MIATLRAVLLPVHIERPAATLLQAGLLFTALLRGIDYMVTPQGEAGRTLGFVEAALPLGTWGAVYAIAGAIGLAGQVIRRYPVAAVAHGVLVGLYLAFGLGQLVLVASMEEHYGWRTGVGWVFVNAVAHAVLGRASLDASERSRWVN